MITEPLPLQQFSTEQLKSHIATMKQNIRNKLSDVRDADILDTDTLVVQPRQVYNIVLKQQPFLLDHAPLGRLRLPSSSRLVVDTGGIIGEVNATQFSVLQRKELSDEIARLSGYLSRDDYLRRVEELNGPTTDKDNFMLYHVLGFNFFQQPDSYTEFEMTPNAHYLIRALHPHHEVEFTDSLLLGPGEIEAFSAGKMGVYLSGVPNILRLPRGSVPMNVTDDEGTPLGSFKPTSIFAVSIKDLAEEFIGRAGLTKGQFTDYLKDNTPSGGTGYRSGIVTGFHFNGVVK